MSYPRNKFYFLYIYVDMYIIFKRQKTTNIKV